MKIFCPHCGKPIHAKFEIERHVPINKEMAKKAQQSIMEWQVASGDSLRRMAISLKVSASQLSRISRGLGASHHTYRKLGIIP